MRPSASHMTYTCSASTAGVLEAKLLNWCMLYVGASKRCSHSGSPVSASNASTICSPVAGSADMRNSRSPQMTGELWPTPGSGCFQRIVARRSTRWECRSRRSALPRSARENGPSSRPQSARCANSQHYGQE